MESKVYIDRLTFALIDNTSFGEIKYIDDVVDIEFIAIKGHEKITGKISLIISENETIKDIKTKILRKLNKISN